MLEHVDAVVNLPEAAAGTSAARAGAYLESLRRAYLEVDVDQVRALIAFMRDTMGATARSGVVDANALTDDVIRLYSLLKEVVRAGNELAVHVEHEANDQMVAAAQDEAWQTPGSEIRVTEHVQGPGGDLTVVRDVVSVGLTPDTHAPEVRPSSAERVQLLGLDDASAETARERVTHLRTARTLQHLKLSEDAGEDEVERAVIKRIDSRSRNDVAIRAIIGSLPGGFRNLLPGHVHAFNAALHSMLIESFVDMHSRRIRGDQRAAATAFLHLNCAMALSYAAPYYLPIAQIVDSELGGNDVTGVGDPHDIFVFHDVPLLLGPGVETLGWLFPIDDTGHVEDLAEVVLRDVDGSHLEVVAVSLRAGEASHIARRVLAAITTLTWTVPKRRKLPGEPGDKTWAAALGRHAKAELQSGSLARVRRHVGDSAPPVQ